MAATAPSTARFTNYDEFMEDEVEPAPPPKKKRMTKEERQERNRQKELEFQKLEITDHLRREVGLAKKSVTRGKRLWMQMCRQIKFVQMKRELRAWEIKSNRVLKQKDESIEFILEDIAKTKAMHKKGFGAQLKTLDYLLDIFHAFQDHLRLQYEKQCEEILHDFGNKTCELSEIQEAYEEKFHKKLGNTNASLLKQLFGDFEKCIDKRNDIVNDEIIKRYKLRDDTNNKMTSLQNQLQEFLNALLNASLDVLKYDKVKHLMQRQRTFVTEFNKWNLSELRKTQKVHDLLKELEELKEADRLKMKDLNEEHAYFLGVHRSIEKRMDRDRQDIHEKLKVLTTECYGFCKSLEKLKKYGELLLSLSANCKKLQTESEKVTLLGDFQEPSQAAQTEEMKEFKLELIDLKSHIDLNENELIAQMRLMKNFWRRQALAEAQTVLLEEKKRLLLIENQRYIDKIKSLSKADDVVDLQKALTIECLIDEIPPCHSNSCSSK